MEKKLKVTYQVSEGTAVYLSVLAAITRAEHTFINTLFELFGEENGDKLYGTYSQVFSDMRTKIERELLENINDNMDHFENLENHVI